MADVHDKQTRSYNMSRIKGKNTSPEIMVRKFLFANGFRFRLHDKKLPGKPDILLPKYKLAIFVNGCFWHGHENCKYFVIPKTRTDWWLQKINTTKLHDEENFSKLNSKGWNVLSIFECELKKGEINTTLTALLNHLIKSQMLKQIKTTKNVITFAKQLIKEGVNIHPDDDFNGFINLETKESAYSKEEADFRNEVMNQCFEVCEKNGVDIYDTMNEVLLKETGLDKFIPLPSAAYSE